MNVLNPKVEVTRIDPISPQQRTLLTGVRQALLMMVDAIEVYLGFEVRTAQLRKEKR